ncbi:MAG: SAM-dependent methyltransferase, partial [Alphaproteobacteria bacterium]
PAIGDALAVSTIWPESRIELANAIWGDLHLSPETSSVLPAYISGLGMDPSMTVVEIGTGLGALSRTMHLKSGAYVLGFEVDQALVYRAADLAYQWGLRCKTQFDVLDPSEVELKGVRARSVDRMVIHSTLPYILDIDALIKNLVAAFRPGGLLLLGDLFACEGQEKHRAVRKWQSSIGGRPQLTPWFKVKRQLEIAGFEIHVQERISDVYAEAIASGLQEYLARVTDGEISVKQLTPALAESQKWMSLQRALKAGAMEYRRVSATFRG